MRTHAAVRLREDVRKSHGSGISLCGALGVARFVPKAISLAFVVSQEAIPSILAKAAKEVKARTGVVELDLLSKQIRAYFRHGSQPGRSTFVVWPRNVPLHLFRGLFQIGHADVAGR